MRRNNFHSHSLTTSSHPSPTFASSHSSASLAANSTVPLAGETRLNEIVDRCNVGSCCIHSDLNESFHLLFYSGSKIWQRQAMLTERINGDVLTYYRLCMFHYHCHCHIFFVHLTNSVKIHCNAQTQLWNQRAACIVLQIFRFCCCALLPALIKNLQHFFSL